MNSNPYEPGTDEYLDYATKQHDAAMIKEKKPKKVQKKVERKQGLAERSMNSDINELMKSRKAGKNILSEGLSSLFKK